MLLNALPALASGGRLVYATCSLEPEENEGVVEKVLNEQPAFRVLTVTKLALAHPRLVPLFDSGGYFRTRPDQHAMDGFNAAVFVGGKTDSRPGLHVKRLFRHVDFLSLWEIVTGFLSGVS